MKTIGVDVGGPLADIIDCDLTSHQIAIHKVSTTPDVPSGLSSKASASSVARTASQPVTSTMCRSG